MATVTLFKSKMSYSRVLLHSECHITTFLEGDPIKNQFKWQIELYLVSVQRRKWLYALFQDPKVPFNDFKGGAKGKTHIRDHNQKLKKGMLTYESVWFLRICIDIVFCS